MTDLKPFTAGYMKPPKQHRFKKGRSGNPRGRPKKNKDGLKDILDAVKKTKVKIAGEDRSITLEEAMALRLRNLVLQGHPRALELFDKYQPHATSNIVERPSRQEDLHMIDIMRERRELIRELRASGEFQEQHGEGKADDRV